MLFNGARPRGKGLAARPASVAAPGVTMDP